MSVASTTTLVTALGAGKRSVGDFNQEIQEVSLVSGDVSIVATAKSLSRVDYAVLVGATQTASPSFSGNVATFTIADPVASIKCQIILMGR